MRRRAARIVVLAGMGWGCVYYNGLWSAHRYAADARRAERDGQHEVAVSNWSVAAVEAESVAVHHPHSRWLPEALVTAAEGLAGAGDCAAAAAYLARADSVKTDEAHRERLALVRARCALDAEDADAAEAFARPVLGSRDEERRRRAALLAGRAARLRGSYDQAVDLFARSPERRAGVEEALTLIAAGHLGRADSLCDQLVDRKLLEADWDSIFAAFDAAAAADSTSRLVGRVVPRARLSPGARARLYLDDGYRLLEAGEPSAAGDRFAQAAAAAPDSAEFDKAQVARLQARVAALTSRDGLDSVTADLAQYLARGSGVTEARRLAHLVGQVAVPDSTVVATFRLGELARDSLFARPLAATLLLGFARREPQSLFAPKAILAAIPLSPERSDSLLGVLDAQYPRSPYLLALRGSPSPGFRAAEDSLADLFGIRAPIQTAAPALAFAGWTPPLTGKRGPLLDPPEPVATAILRPPGSGRRGVADTLK